jgi:hypothetical protein
MSAAAPGKKPARPPGGDDRQAGVSVFLEDRKTYGSNFRFSTLCLLFAYLYFGAHILFYFFADYAYL